MPYALKPSGDGDSFNMPREIVRHLSGASENDLKVVIHLYSEFPTGFEKSDAEKIASALSVTVDEVNAAISFWRGAGLVKTVKTIKSAAAPTSSAQASAAPTSSAPRRQARSDYPSEQLAAAIESVPNMKPLVDYCQRRFGKIFSPAQLSTLYSFYDNLGFSVDSIMLVAEHCSIIEKPSLGYMERIIHTLSDNGITEYADVEKNLAARLNYTMQEGKLRKLCGFTARELSPSEKKIIGVWFNEWSLDFSLIEKAYGITVDRISRPSLKYMNTILTNWHEQGITDPAQVEERRKSDEFIEKSHDAEELFRAAVAKTMGETDT